MFGGQGMGGGNFIRTATRAVARATVAGGGLQDAAATATRPSSPTSTSRATRQYGGSATFHGLSSASSQSHCPVAAATWPFCNRCCDEFASISEEHENGCWSVPSVDEVHGAVSALHRVFGGEEEEEEEDSGPGRVGEYTALVNRVYAVGSEVDWVEPCLELQMGGPGPGPGVQRVSDAFHLLQTDPSVQRIVMSVSSDKAVWDAILNNEAVQHLRNSFYEAKDDDGPQSSEESSPDKPSDESTNVIQWMFDNTKTRVMEVIERITELVNQMFENGNDDDDGDEKKRAAEEAMDPFEEKLRTSFFISIVVLLLVMVSRAHKASQ